MRSAVPRILALLLVALTLAACGGPSRERVLLLGFDGADPDVIDLLISEGKLPNFAKMRQGGAYGKLRSAQPLLSPVVWTTIATGKTPDEHRIGHFVAVNQTTGEQLPVTSQMRKAQAIWNIASDAGKKVGVVGYWATWPAETVNGSIVSDHLCYHFLFEDSFRKPSTNTTGNTYPPELEKEAAALARRPADVTKEEVSKFITVSDEEFARPFNFQDPVGHFKWALATADSYRKIGLDLWKRQQPDLLMVYIEATDSTAHLFGHLFREKDLAGELRDQQKKFGDAVERMYVYADGILGDFMGAMDRGTTLLVVSDHGFRLGELPDDPSRTRDMRRVSEQFHALHGIFYAYGNRVRPAVRVDGAGILDVTPTILTLLGIPAGQDMPGQVIAGPFKDLAAPARVATYETGRRDGSQAAGDSKVDAEILEQLRSLGYLQTASPSGDRNLAAVLFSSGKFAEAAAAYRKLVDADPNDGSLRASLAGSLGALGRYDEALAELDAAIRLQPLNPEAYHNRAVIHQRRGDAAAAIRDYETAL
ncbi:MAG TPA: alkaline phosphatase family protein, partial [Verrucomicrobiae bacterium]|nr:alkaline phosphatase family protein [Verrucomicrobiae bacterium]